MSPRVGLVMIVKNEEAVIERALRSVLPFISTYMIVDTGSTDKTKEIVSSVLSDVSGLIVDRPWKNFGANRSEALAMCDEHMDWAIMLDADDTLEGTVPPPELWSHSELDGIILTIHHESIRHQRIQVFHTGRGWRYSGVVHEFPVCEAPLTQGPTLGHFPSETFMVTRCEGSRSQDPNKYIKDAHLLEVELLTTSDRARTLFYLAQSYRDANCRDAAVSTYRRYLIEVSSDSTTQEYYMVLVNLIRMVDSEQDQFKLTWQALELCPARLEAQYTLLQRRRTTTTTNTTKPSLQLFSIGTAVTNRTPNPMDLLSSPGIYAWEMDNELALVAYSLGRYQVAYNSLARCMIYAPTPEMREAARVSILKTMARMESVLHA